MAMIFGREINIEEHVGGSPLYTPQKPIPEGYTFALHARMHKVDIYTNGWDAPAIQVLENGHQAALDPPGNWRKRLKAGASLSNWVYWLIQDMGQKDLLARVEKEGWLDEKGEPLFKNGRATSKRLFPSPPGLPAGYWYAGTQGGGGGYDAYLGPGDSAWLYTKDGQTLRTPHDSSERLLAYGERKNGADWLHVAYLIKKERESMTSSAKSKTWDLIEAILGMGRAPRVLLAGPPGTGKTRAGCKMGILPEMEVFSLTMTDETPMSEVRGHFIAKGGSFEFHYGVLVQAWRASHAHPVRVVINEIDHTGADCASFLHAFLDDPELQEAGHGYRLPNGEDVKPGSHGVQVVATMNGAFEDLPDALLDRFPVRLMVMETHPEALATLHTKGLQNTAKAAANRTGAQRVSIRAFKEYERLLPLIGAEGAAQSVFGGRSQELLDALRIAS